ncbi:peptidoglycan recognition family protein [Pseudovibrio sp. Ad37]|uniref:peptidoglycan recognition protein family protein n=1 Tax=Pseudovibrio sp. Ad37 TaxID=989422 RepID=UPI0007B27060|nr:peptidoglycan recognition family protein [Pseudovibrio sp. Ad37]KZL22720.1 N-acetylmuramoyl-L-alanine amidase [Pseudovibrio sp. Ad37]
MSSYFSFLDVLVSQAVKSACGTFSFFSAAQPDTPTSKTGLKRIVMHWTAGADGVNSLERNHYHLIVDRKGKVHAGALKPEANVNCRDGQYAAHTRALNTGSIGIAMDAMAGATESPFNAGKYPITKEQVRAFAEVVADLCETYQIPIARQTVLTHAEVQPVLKVRQRCKWDITWLPGMERPGKPIEVGDRLRELIKAAVLS